MALFRKRNKLSKKLAYLLNKNGLVDDPWIKLVFTDTGLADLKSEPFVPESFIFNKIENKISQKQYFLGRCNKYQYLLEFHQ